MRAIVVLDDRGAATAATLARLIGASPCTALRQLAIRGCVEELEMLEPSDREALVAVIATAEEIIAEDDKYGSHTYLSEEAVKEILERAIQRLAAKGEKNRERARRAAELLHLTPP